MHQALEHVNQTLTRRWTAAMRVVRMSVPFGVCATHRTTALMLLGFLLLPGTVLAQQGTPDILPFELERNQDFQDLIRFRRVQGELVYIDQLNGEIPMDGLTLRQPESPRVPSVDGDGLTVPEMISRGALLVAILFLALLIWRNRTWLGLLLGQTPQRAAPPEGAADVQTLPGTAPDASLLARLRAMADREAAIVMLLEEALKQAAQANGLRLSRSETAREFLRRLPPDWIHGAPLRRLVMAEELVQFGGRDLAVDTFEQCLRDAAPIMGWRGA